MLRALAATPLAPLAMKFAPPVERGIQWSGWRDGPGLTKQGVYSWQGLEEIVEVSYHEITGIPDSARLDLLAGKINSAIDALAIRAGLK